MKTRDSSCPCSSCWRSPRARTPPLTAPPGDFGDVVVDTRWSGASTCRSRADGAELGLWVRSRGAASDPDDFDVSTSTNACQARDPRRWRRASSASGSRPTGAERASASLIVDVSIGDVGTTIPRRTRGSGIPAPPGRTGGDNGAAGPDRGGGHRRATGRAAGVAGPAGPKGDTRRGPGRRARRGARSRPRARRAGGRRRRAAGSSCCRPRWRRRRSTCASSRAATLSRAAAPGARGASRCATASASGRAATRSRFRSRSAAAASARASRSGCASDSCSVAP